MSWPTARLADLTASATAGFACGESDSEGIAQIRMNNVGLDGAINFEKVRRVPRTAAPMDRYLLQYDDVLFNATNSPELVGKTALARELPEPFVYSNHFIRIRPDQSKLLPSFLARWLTAQQQAGRFELMCNKWVNQASVRREDLLALRMPLPPLPEQRRIAAILDKADTLRAKRRKSIAKLDQLVHSVFRNKFPAPGGFPVVIGKPGGEGAKHFVPLTSVARLATGHTPDRAVPEYWGGHIPWLCLTDIRQLDGRVALDTEQHTTEAGIANSSAVLLPQNTVCLSRTASIGFATILGREMATSQDFVNWVCSDALNPYYLLTAFRASQPYLKAKSTGSTHKTIYFPAAEQFHVYYPSQNDQRDFEAVLRWTWKQKNFADRQLMKSASLFDSLESAGFGGTL